MVCDHHLVMKCDSVMRRDHLMVYGHCHVMVRDRVEVYGYRPVMPCDPVMMLDPVSGCVTIAIPLCVTLRDVWSSPCREM